MKVRRVSISVQLFLVMSVLLLAANLFLGIFLYRRTVSLMQAQIRNNAIDVAKCAAADVDPEDLAAIEVGGEASEPYQNVLKRLRVYLDNSSAASSASSR